MREAAIVVALVVVGLSAASAEGQTVFTGGAKGGITFATLPAAGTELDADTGYRMGALAGGFVAVEFRGMYAFQPEFLYAMKGVELSYQGYTQKDAIELSYLEIPLLFKFHSGDLAQFVNGRLRRTFGTIWFVGGGVVSAECLRLGLADEVRYSILPIVIGDGIPFFERFDGDIALHLAEVKAYKSGMVELRYEVRKHRGESRNAT